MQLFVSLFASWTSWVNSGLSYSVICILYYILCKCTTLHPACILNFYILDFIFEIYVFKNYLYFIFLHSTKEVLKKTSFTQWKLFYHCLFSVSIERKWDGCCYWARRLQTGEAQYLPGYFLMSEPRWWKVRPGAAQVNALNTHHWHCQPAQGGQKYISLIQLTAESPSLSAR